MLTRFTRATGLAAWILLCRTPATAPAQPPAPRWELILGPGGMMSSDGTSGGLGAGGSVGYFICDPLELSLRESVLYSSFPNGTNAVINSRLALDYELGRGRLRPFIGAEAGYVIGLHSASSLEAGPEIGVRYFLKDSTFVYGAAEWERFFRQSSFRGGIRQSEIIFSFGIGFRW